MSYRHTRDRYVPGTYHVFKRRNNGLPMFRDDQDRRTFEEMMNRHLSKIPHTDRRGRRYRSFYGQLEMCARNLLTTHFHLVFIQKEPGAIEQLMQRVMTAYTRYYNRRHGAEGPLYEGRYCSRRMEGLKSFRWRVGYVVDNHKAKGVDWKFSTHHRMVGADTPSWLAAETTLRLFGGLDGYLDYMRKRRYRAALDEELRY